MLVIQPILLLIPQHLPQKAIRAPPLPDPLPRLRHQREIQLHLLPPHPRGPSLPPRQRRGHHLQEGERVHRRRGPLLQHGGELVLRGVQRAHVWRVEAGAAHAVHGGEDDGGGVPPHVVVVARRVAEEVGEGLRGLGVLDGEDGVDAVDGEEGLDYAALDAPGGAVGE